MNSKCRPGARARFGLAALVLSGLAFPAHAGLFNNNFNSDPSGVLTLVEPAKWVASGGVGGSGYISITDAVNDQTGAFLIEDLDGGADVAGFSATFKLRMGGGSGNAADGFSFNWAGNLTGSAISEEGQGNGLTIAFDIYDNGGGEAPAIDIKVGGVVIKSTKFAKADILTGADFVDVRVEYKNGLLDVDFKGQAICDNLPIGLAPIAGGRFGFGARTGGENNNNWVDDLRIETFAATAPSVTSLRGTAKGFVVRLQDAPNAAIDATSVKANLDGAAVTGSATKSGQYTIYTFAGADLLAKGSSHPVSVSYKYGAAGTSVTQNLTVTVPDYTVIPAAMALPAGTIDTTKRGFTWLIHQVDSATTLPNSNARAVDQLAGLLGNNIADPNSVGPAEAAAAAPSPATAPLQFKIPGVINLSQIDADNKGNVTPDAQMPGVPGTLGTDNNMAAAAITAVEFTAAGTYEMIVNSDDGFKTTVGKNPSDTFAPTLGIFDTGRGASDTVFSFYVEAPGFYAFRTLYFEGDGDANIEWLATTPSETHVLLNDTATDPQVLKAYQIPATALPAYVRSVTPAPGSSPILQGKTVEAVLVDAGTQVTASSVKLKLNGTEVTATVTKNNGLTKLVYSGGVLPSTQYTAELVYTDSAGPRSSSWNFKSGLVKEPLFVIEAEDFDADGQANPQKGVEGKDVDVMPYYGGAYDGLTATKGVDYNNADGNDSDFYRTELDANGENEVNLSTRNNVAGGNGLGDNPSINSSDRLTYTTTVNYGIGWVGSGDWQNYTRNFPNNGTGWWRVFAGLSYGGADPGQLSGSLDRVTDGVGTSTQTTERLGEFTAPGSGGWANNNLVPLKTASGTPAVIKLVGKSTLRWNITSGDADFLIFSTAAPPPPAVDSVPLDSVPRNAVILDWVLRDTDSKVNTASVKLLFDGQDVSAKTTTTKTDTGATVHLDLSGTTYAAGDHSWKLTFADNSSPAQTVEASGTALVIPYPAQGLFIVEAEDFNYSDDGVTGGKANPRKGEADADVNVMPYLGGAYDGLSAVEGVDYNNEDGNDSDFYRSEKDANGENEVNIGVSNGNRLSNDRGWFETTSNYRIGWVAVGDWQNYTRTFPQGSFNIWAAMSYDGRTAGQITGSLDLVTSDPTKPNQTTQRLGAFNAPGSGGWGRNELVPMKDTNGVIATVPMGGVQTIRFNTASGDIDYLVLVPAQSADQPKFEAVTRNADGSLTLQWTGGGTLQTAPTVSGPWTDVAAAASPYKLSPSGAQLFGRIRR